jgi:hypothetical protein
VAAARAALAAAEDGAACGYARLALCRVVCAAPAARRGISAAELLDALRPLFATADASASAASGPARPRQLLPGVSDAHARCGAALAALLPDAAALTPVAEETVAALACAAAEEEDHADASEAADATTAPPSEAALAQGAAARCAFVDWLLSVLPAAWLAEAPALAPARAAVLSALSRRAEAPAAPLARLLRWARALRCAVPRGAPLRGRLCAAAAAQLALEDAAAASADLGGAVWDTAWNERRLEGDARKPRHAWASPRLAALLSACADFDDADDADAGTAAADASPSPGRGAMDAPARRQLAEALAALPMREQARVADIVQRAKAAAAAAAAGGDSAAEDEAEDEPFELDVEALDDATCWQLHELCFPSGGGGADAADADADPAAAAAAGVAAFVAAARALRALAAGAPLPPALAARSGAPPAAAGAGWSADADAALLRYAQEAATDAGVDLTKADASALASLFGVSDRGVVSTAAALKALFGCGPPEDSAAALPALDARRLSRVESYRPAAPPGAAHVAAAAPPPGGLAPACSVQAASGGALAPGGAAAAAAAAVAAASQPSEDADADAALRARPLSERSAAELAGRLGVLCRLSRDLAAPAARRDGLPLACLFARGSFDCAPRSGGTGGADDPDADVAAGDDAAALLRGCASALLPSLRDALLVRALACSAAREGSLASPPSVSVDRRVAAAAAERQAPGDASRSLVHQLRLALYPPGSNGPGFERRHAPRCCRAGAPLWHVTLLGEAAVDMGGPFRESLNCAITELMEAVPHADAAPDGALGLLVPSPNAARAGAEAASFTDCRVPRPGPLRACDAAGLEFLGALIGAALRSGNPLPLRLPPLTWKQLQGGSAAAGLGLADLACVDLRAAAALQRIADCPSPAAWPDYITWASVQHDVSADGMPSSSPAAAGQGTEERVRWEQRGAYAAAALAAQLAAYAPAARAVRRGLLAAVPPGALALLTWRDLASRACGVSEWSVAELRALTRTDTHSHSAAVDAFWAAMGAMTQEERAGVLAFATGRSRLPPPPAALGESAAAGAFGAASAASQPHVLVLDVKRPGDDGDLPSASTCSYALHLPALSDAGAMAAALRTAMQFSGTIDGDGSRNAPGNGGLLQLLDAGGGSGGGDARASEVGAHAGGGDGSWLLQPLWPDAAEDAGSEEEDAGGHGEASAGAAAHSGGDNGVDSAEDEEEEEEEEFESEGSQW